MEITRLEIEEVLRSEDVEGLLDLGAPRDEYSSEARSIASALAAIEVHDLTEDRLAAVVRSVWTRSFGPLSEADLAKRASAFRQVAQRILRVHV